MDGYHTMEQEIAVDPDQPSFVARLLLQPSHLDATSPPPESNVAHTWRPPARPPSPLRPASALERALGPVQSRDDEIQQMLVPKHAQPAWQSAAGLDEGLLSFYPQFPFIWRIPIGTTNKSDE
jgi:hypothetical protein